MTDEVEVTQADREAASQYVAKAFGARYAKSVLVEGRWPNLTLAFARHRLTSQSRSSTTEVERDRDAILAAYRHLKRVGDRLSVCAQTTGGVAGPDEGLQEAVAEWGKCDRLLRDVRMAAAEPDVPITAGVPDEALQSKDHSHG